MVKHIKFYLELPEGTGEADFRAIHEKAMLAKKKTWKSEEESNKIFPLSLWEDFETGALLTPLKLTGELRLVDAKDFDSLVDDLRDLGAKEGTLGSMRYHDCYHDEGKSCPSAITEVWGGYDPDGGVLS